MTDEYPDEARRRVDELFGYAAAGPAARAAAQDATAVAVLLFDAPVAAITVVADELAHHTSTVGMAPSQVPREDAMCTAILAEPDAVVVPDASLDERFRTHPEVDGRHGRVRFYASAPLVTPRGVTIGRLEVFDTEPRHDPGPARAHGLEVTAQGLIATLELHLRTRQLEGTVDELTAARAELARSNEELAGFASRVSHDLRNPLTAVLASTETLLTEPAVAEDSGLAELARAAVDAGRRMELMIREFLAYAQVGGRLHVADVDLGLVLEAVRGDIRPTATRSGATVRVDRLPVVRGDAAQLYAVFLNLVSNALKFARPGATPEVDVHAERIGGRGADGPGAWRITVADRGRGVPVEDRDHIFQAFARGRREDHRRTEGSGIGLSVARRVVAAHGGRIGVEDRPGGGSVFWVELPG